MADLVVFGSLNMDLVVRVPRFPLPGETIAGRGFRTVPGGKGANQAVAAARQGARVSMAGRVGGDTFGERLLASLRAEGVDTGHVSVEPDLSTGLAIISVDDAGENSIMLVAGANGKVAPADAEAAAPYIAGAGALVMALEVPLAAVTRAAEIARERGVL